MRVWGHPFLNPRSTALTAHGAANISRRRSIVARVDTQKDEASTGENATEKYGLEVGLYQALTSKDGDAGSKITNAKDLLKRYGSAYLITSISLSLVSITVFYLLIDNGVDVAALLARIGLEVSGTSEKVGTFALAYAAHKAASPIRFPPTVALTPVVAKALGKDQNVDADSDESP